jgi:hypothetical protein
MDAWILGTMIVGFILTWIICHGSSSESELDIKPSGFMMVNPYDAEKEELRRKVYTLERELYYRRYDRPVEVNIDNIVKVDTNAAVSQSSSRK